VKKSIWHSSTSEIVDRSRASSGDDNENDNTFNYIPAYCGPPPPSGTVQLMNSRCVLIEQHLQCTQFCQLMTKVSFSGSFGSLPSFWYSYTRAGQKRCSGPQYTSNDSDSHTYHSSGFTRKCQGWSWSWFTPERHRFSRISKDSTPSGLGYSISFTLTSLFGSVYS